MLGTGDAITSVRRWERIMITADWSWWWVYVTAFIIEYDENVGGGSISEYCREKATSRGCISSGEVILINSLSAFIATTKSVVQGMCSECQILRTDPSRK